MQSQAECDKEAAQAEERLMAHSRLIAFLAGAACVLGLSGAGAGPEPKTIPDFSGPWALTGNAFDFAPPRTGVGPGPMVNISGDRLVPVGNYDTPLLKPWAAAEV